jgi:hypothetical protein
MSRSYYIYYRSNEPAERVRATVAAMFEAVARDTGIRGRLLHRCDDATTWMEIYDDVGDPASFERGLAGAVEAHGARTLLAPGAERHVEQFMDA